jgi:hypothetical protein
MVATKELILAPSTQYRPTGSARDKYCEYHELFNELKLGDGVWTTHGTLFLPVGQRRLQLYMGSP